MEKKVAYYTLGCKLNFAETSTLVRQFTDDGYVPVSKGPADVVIINTCTVTDAADRKSRQTITKCIRQNPGALVIVTGCMAQLKPEFVSGIEGVNLVLGNQDKYRIKELLHQIKEPSETLVFSCGRDELSSFHASWSAGNRTRSFLKVQDGCDYECSYCTIPMARGKSRNAPLKELVNQAQEIGNQGVEEIVLTGVNIGDFGQSSGESFLSLVKALDQVETISRFRISSIEPNLLEEELIRYVSQSRAFLPHFHIPLQSGCNLVLKRMRRRYYRETFEDRIRRIKQFMPDAAIGADVIVGFPGETKEEFEDTRGFIESLPLSYLHVFPFSARRNTLAEKLEEQVDPRVKTERSQILHLLSEKMNKAFLLNQAGKMAEVLFEQKDPDGSWLGYSRNYLKVKAGSEENLHGRIRQVKLSNQPEAESITGILL